MLVHNADYNDPNPKVNEILKDKQSKKSNSKSLLQYEDVSGEGYSKVISDFNHLECENVKSIDISSGGWVE